MKFYWLIFLGLLVAPASLVYANDIANGSLPQIVECKTASICDRDHLKDFLISFYKWYNRTSKQLYPANFSDAARQRLLFQQNIGEFISAPFLEKIAPTADTDFDGIMCAQDNYDQENGEPDVAVLNMDEGTALLSVRLFFTKCPPASEKYIYVSMKIVDHKWLIDRVTCRN